MSIFLAAKLVSASQIEHSEWQDCSTADYFVFRSSFGECKLRKRRSYPVTFAKASGPLLWLGYGNPDTVAGTAAQDYSQEFLRIEINCATQRVTVRRDAFCTLPLFVGELPELLVLSNTFEEIGNLPTPRRPRVNLARLGDYIFDQTIKRQDTYIDCITTVGEREVYTWQRGKVHRKHLAETEHRTVTESDPSIFRHSLDALFAEYAARYIGNRPVGAEFSAGIDSSMVAGYLADNGYDPLLVTLGFPGVHQKTQRKKIADFETRFRTRHLAANLDVEALFPLSRMQRNGWQPFYEREEIYREGFELCARQLAAEGIDTVFNGIGGDDTLAKNQIAFAGYNPASYYDQTFLQTLRQHQAERTWERIADSLVPLQVLMARTSHNNVYLEHGIWPVSPLADPQLVAYAQGLRLRFRDNKNIYRMYCQAWNYPEAIYRWRVNEDFGSFFQMCAARHFAGFGEQWLERSVLAEAGAIDRRKALDFVRSARSVQDAYNAYKLITVESNLQLLGATLAV